jgi:hypothetical protein
MGQALESQGKVEKSLGGCASIAMTSAMLGQPRVRVNNLIASEVKTKYRSSAKGSSVRQLGRFEATKIYL